MFDVLTSFLWLHVFSGFWLTNPRGCNCLVLLLQVRPLPLIFLVGHHVLHLILLRNRTFGRPLWKSSLLCHDSLRRLDSPSFSWTLPSNLTRCASNHNGGIVQPEILNQCNEERSKTILDWDGIVYQNLKNEFKLFKGTEIHVFFFTIDVTSH